MAGNSKRVVTLDLRVNLTGEEAKKEAQKLGKDIKSILSDIGKSGDAMSYFKELIRYIGAVDSKMASFANKYGHNMLNKIFGDLDNNLRKEMEDLFGVTSKQLNAVDELRKKIQAARANKDTTKDDAKLLKKEVEDLYGSLGKSDEINISNKLGVKRMLEESEAALDHFAIVWKEANNKISEGLNFGSIEDSGLPKFSEEVKQEINKIENEIENLKNIKKEFQKALRDLKESQKLSKNELFNEEEYSPDTSIEGVRKLMDEFEELRQKVNSGSKDSLEYYQNLAKLSEVAIKLQNSQKAISADKNLELQFRNEPGKNLNAEDMMQELIKYSKGQTEILSRKMTDANGINKIQGFIDDKNKQIAAVKQGDLSGLISDYDKLSQKIREFNNLQKKLDSPDISDEDYDNLSDQLVDLQQEIVLLSKVGDKAEEVDEILSNLAFEKITESEALEKIASTLGIVKENAKEAKSAIDGIDDSGTGTSGTKTQGGDTGSSGTGSDGIDNKITNIDFSTLEAAIKSEMSAIANKLDGILQVKLVDDNSADIQKAVAGMKVTLDGIGATIDAYKASKQKESEQVEVDNMKENLRQLLKYVSDVNNQKRKSGYNAGEYQEQETTASIFSDGSIVTNYGEDGTVPWNRMISVLLSNLSKTSLMDIHSHPWGTMGDGNKFANDAFSGARGDLSAFRRTKELGTQIASMITGNIMRTFDVSKLTDTQMTKFRTELSKIEHDIPNRPDIQKYVGHKNGSTYFKGQDTLEGQHKVTEIFESMMYEAFNKIGISKDQVDQDIFKKYDLTNEAELTDLATRLVQLSSASQSAVNPIERLSQIISAFGGNVNTKDAESVFESYKKGELSVADVFNKLTYDSVPVNQDTINSLNRINSATDNSPTLSYLSQVVSILGSINSTLGSIEIATRQDSEQKLNTAMKDILDVYNGQESKYLANRTKSEFDPQNVSEYKALDMIRNAASQAYNTMFDIENAKLFGSDKDAQLANDVLSKFYSTLFSIKDAMKQAELLESRNPDIDISQEKNKLKQRYDDLIGDENIKSLLSVVSGVKENIRAEKSKYGLNDSVGTTQVDLDVAQISNALQSALQRINIQSTESDQNIDTQSLQSLSSTLQMFCQSLTSIFSDVAKDETLNKIASLVSAISDRINFNKDKESNEDQTEDDSRLDNVLPRLADAINELSAILQTVFKVNNGENADSTVDQSSDLYKALSSALSDVATESTLSKIAGLLAGIASTLNVDTGEDKDKNKDENNKDAIDSLPKLIASLGDAVTELKNVANGIVQHQKAQKTDRSAATARIQNNYQDLSAKAKSVAINTDGFTDEVQIDKMKALADGVVSVEGAVKDADGVWQGFRVHIDEANNATIEAIGNQTAFARSLNNVNKIVNDSSSDKDTTDDIDKQLLGVQQLKDKEKQLTREMNSLGFSVADSDLSDQQKEIVAEYQRIIDVINDYQKAVSNGQQVEMASLNQSIAALRQKTTEYKIQQGILNGQNQSGQKFGSTAVLTETARYNKLLNYATDPADGFSSSDSFLAQFNAYETKYKELIALRQRLAAQDSISDEEISDFKQLQKECAAAAQSIEKVVKASMKLKSNSVNSTPLGEDFENTVLGRKDALTNFVTSMHGADAEIQGFRNNFSQLVYTVKDGSGSFTTMTAHIDDARNSIVEVAGNTGKSTTALGRFFDELKGKFRSISTYFISSMGIEEVWQQFRMGVQYVREVDLALTELKKVTDETDETYSRFLQNMSQVGSQIGATTSELVNSAAD